MKYLFGEEGKLALKKLSNTRSLYAFDFDGTLASIVPHPQNAFLSDEVVALLTKLSSTSSVAVITGRGVADLRRRLLFTPHYIVGNHGIEGGHVSPQWQTYSSNVTQEWHKTLSEALSQCNMQNEIILENKSYSISIHYRLAKKKRSALNCIKTLLQSLHPNPRTVFGKAVVNIIPMGAPHKGEALSRLLADSGCDAALYVGDDDTDEDIFALSDQRIITVRVGRKQSSHARFYLRKQSDIVQLLTTLVDSQHAVRQPREVC